MLEILTKLKNLILKSWRGNKFSLVNQPCFDKHGNFIGWFSRSMATAIFVFCRDKNGQWNVLASERGKGAADFQGYWNSCCGYLDFNETTKQCAIRELKEETGVEIDEKDITFIGYEDSPNANHQNVTFRFAAILNSKVTDDFVFSHGLNEKNEVGEIKWIPLGEVDKYQWAFGHMERISEIAEQFKIG